MVKRHCPPLPRFQVNAYGSIDATSARSSSRPRTEKIQIASPISDAGHSTAPMIDVHWSNPNHFVWKGRTNSPVTPTSTVATGWPANLLRTYAAALMRAVLGSPSAKR